MYHIHKPREKRVCVSLLYVLFPLLFRAETELKTGTELREKVIKLDGWGAGPGTKKGYHKGCFGQSKILRKLKREQAIYPSYQ